MGWIGENWAGILGVIGGFHAIAKIIVTWTPTKKDDKVLATIVGFFRVVGLQPKGN